jgi:hypothetical protein
LTNRLAIDPRHFNFPRPTQYEGNYSEVGAYRCNIIVIEFLMMGNYQVRRGTWRSSDLSIKRYWAA